jgi:hypothetical protein
MAVQVVLGIIGTIALLILLIRTHMRRPLKSIYFSCAYSYSALLPVVSRWNPPLHNFHHRVYLYQHRR